MDALLNPFAPGAGVPPPQLAGRSEIIKEIKFAYQRAILGKPSCFFLLLGQRGVGKTVLLGEIAKIAAEDKAIISEIEVLKNASFATLLYPEMARVLRVCSVNKTSQNTEVKGLKALRAFALAHKIKAQDTEVSVKPYPDIAGRGGDIENDLPCLFELIGEALKQAQKAWVLLFDEMQDLNKKEFSALITALHKINQQGLPIVVVGAGLPQAISLATSSKSYAKRFLTYHEVGFLSYDAIVEAVREPLNSHNISIEEEALEEIAKVTLGYPFFLQELAYHMWNITQGDIIKPLDVKNAKRLTLKSLDEGFFKVRLEGLSPKEINFIKTMAFLGTGPYLSSDITEHLQGNTQKGSQVRASLIKKGVIYSPKFKYLDFTVPLFADYIKRFKV